MTANPSFWRQYLHQFVSCSIGIGLLAGAFNLKAQENLLITEFMAVNASGIQDDFRQYSDWIEIYNAGTNTVNLYQWYLTDAAGSLTKWRFLTNAYLGPYEYLLVYASGINRATNQPFHTNFRLDAGGEYLALVKPDGTTIVSQYAPAFPAQQVDISYGLGMVPSPYMHFVPEGAPVRALVPGSDLGTTWTALDYNDSSWLSGVTGVGYDTGTNYPSAIALDLGSQMNNVNASAYLRLPFEVTDPSQFQELKLRMRYDDGFIAYLNGVEVLRTNAPVNADYTSSATRMHGSETGATGKLEANFDDANPNYVPTTALSAPGPTIQNAAAGTTGKFLRLLNDAVNDNINSVAFDQTVPGVFPLITADFDFRISDTEANPADGFAFMLIPTSLYGTTGPGVTPYAGIEEPNIASVFCIGFDLYPHASQNDVSAHWNGTEYMNVNIPPSVLDMVNAKFHHCKMTLEYTADGAYVSVVISPDVNGAGGPPFVAIDRLFIPGMPQYDSRIEFGGRTGGANMSVDLDNILVQFGYPTGMVPVEEFTISSALPLLQPGSNVLAIHGLNISSASGDFLIEPQLLARSIGLQSSTVFFDKPTPGGANEGGDAEAAQPPIFSTPGGVYTNDLELALSSPLPNAVIHYTLNGTMPTEDSLLYTNPIPVTNSLLIRAKVFAPGYFASRPVSECYTLLETNVLNFNSRLPLLIFDTFSQSIARGMNPQASMNLTIIDTTQPSERATLLDKPDFHGRVGVEGHGQSSWGFVKKPYNLQFWDENNRGKKESFLNFPPTEDFVLLAPYTDKTFMNDFLAYELHEKMGHYAVRRRFVEVFWNGTGSDGRTDPSGKVGMNDCQGIYVLLEKIRIDANHLDIATLDPADNFEPNISGGYVWVRDPGKPSAGDVNFTTWSGQPLIFYQPKGDKLTPAQTNWLVQHLNAFEQVLYGSNWRDPINGYAKYIDVDSFVDYHWIVEFPKNIDGYRLSNYMHKDRNGKIHMEPMWDWNLSFGNANYLEGGWTRNWYWPLCSSSDHIWQRRLIAEPGDPNYNQKIVDRWGELRLDVLNPTNIINRITEITNLISESAVRDFARWPRLGTYVWPNPNGAAGGWDVDFQNSNTFSGIIFDMKKWVQGRYNWIETQILKAPLFSRYSGFPEAPLGMVAPSGGTIYYTVDGSDPRLSGGTINPNALICSSYIDLPPNARIVARAKQGNNWSPPTKANFGDVVPKLAISEIMYHPAEDALGDSSSYEFIELVNTSGEAIDLTGMRLEGGVDFVFSSGPQVLVGSITTNDFDHPGTAYTAAKLGDGSAPTVTSGGPTANFLRLLTETETNNNRITFDQTATGTYDRITAEFDFRATNLTYIPPGDYGLPTTQNFDDPGTGYTIVSSDTTGVNIPKVTSADSGSQGSFMRVTPAVNSLVNGVYFDQTAAGIYNTIVATFDFRMTGASPADGMSFALLNTANHGTTGVSPVINGGFGEDPNFIGALGVAFDNYNNNVPPSEPNDNHVSIHWNNAQVTPNPVTPSFRLVAGVFHRAQITVRFESGNMYVTVAVTPNVYAGSSSAQTLYDNFLIPGVAPFNGRVAFGARTGGLNAAQDLDNVNVQYGNVEFPASCGLSMVLLPVDKFGATGSGSGLADYATLPTLSNALALNMEMHVSESINNASLYWNRSLLAKSTLNPATFDLDNGRFHHAKLDITPTENGSFATLTLTPDVFGTPGAPITVMSNQFITNFFASDLRVEFAGYSGGQNVSMDLENVKVAFERLTPNWLQPGQRILIVKNRAAFESRYGTGLPIAGEYVGTLDNAGERLTLFGALGEPILDFRYNNSWYPITDGAGFSLVCTNTSALFTQWDNPLNWRPSTLAGGSPGASDTAAPVFVPVRVNEVRSHPDTNALPGAMDAIELYNPSSTTSANISYWYLTDNFNSPKKYRIPLGTIIPPGGFAVFYETNFNAAALGENAFAIRAEGEEVYLFSADAAGNLTGYYHGFDFGASAPNATFGRHVISTGEEHFVAQSSSTLRATNSGPLIGPIVISEVMYHPPDFSDGSDNVVLEFIELRNTSSQPAALFESDPANTWRLKDAVDFQFPAGATIPALGSALVVSFDPVWHPEALTFFASQYGLGPETLIFGPYEGKLNNAGDSVELAKPVMFGNAGEVDYALVDKVKYSDAAPWPLAADGMGYSLQRIQLDKYGNDPANWGVGAPTPAGAYNAGTPPTITTPPASQTIFAGQDAIFTVVADGTGPFNYQWRYTSLGGQTQNLPGETNATLALSLVQISQAGYYQVTVLNAAGAVDSSTASLTVYQGVIISTQPLSRYVGIGSNATISVAAYGNGPLSYQWLFNGVALDYGNRSSLTLTNFSSEMAGNYVCVVQDGVSSVASEPAELKSLEKVFITRQPEGTTGIEGQSAVFNIGVGGTPPMNYVWKRNFVAYTNGITVHGDTDSILTMTNLTCTNDWDKISVTVNNMGGFVTSSNALLRVLYTPVTLNPQLTNMLLYAGGDAIFRGRFRANPEASCAWWFNGTNLLSVSNNIWATNTAGTLVSMTITNVSFENEGTYMFTASNAMGVTTSRVVTLTIRRPPSILEQPTDQYAAIGERATFSVTVTGAPPFTFRWRLNGTNISPITPNAAYPTYGSTNRILIITNVQPARVGEYSLVITNTLGAVTSSIARLILYTPANLTGVQFDASKGEFQFSIPTTDGLTYTVEYKDYLEDPEWKILKTINGDGTAIPVADPVEPPPAPQQRFYRIRIQ